MLSGLNKNSRYLQNGGSADADEQRKKSVETGQGQNSKQATHPKGKDKNTTVHFTKVKAAGIDFMSEISHFHLENPSCDLISATQTMTRPIQVL